MKTIEDYNTLVKTYIDTKDSAKAPTDHSSTATTYGVGSTTKYGHVKVDDALSSTSTNPVQNKKVYELKQALSNEVTTRAILGAHNILPFPYEQSSVADSSSGVAFTANSDGTVTVSKTGSPTANSVFTLTTTLKLPAGKYILSGCPSGGSGSTYYMQGFGNVDYTTGSGILDTGNGVTFTLTATNTLTIKIYIRTGWSGGTLVFKPMIRMAEDSDTTYQQYAQKNLNLLSYEDNGILGAKNFIPYNLANIKSRNSAGTWSDNVYTVTDGDTKTITLTVNSDGSISVNGTAPSLIAFIIASPITLDNAKSYIMSGCPSGGSNSTYRVDFGVQAISDYGSGIMFKGTQYSNAAPYNYFRIVIFADAVLNNLTFYPMVRLATDTDPTYQPYAMTNRELTEKAIMSTETVSSDVGAIVVRRLNGVLFLTIDQLTAQVGTSWTAVGTTSIPLDHNSSVGHLMTNGGKLIKANVYANGSIRLTAVETVASGTYVQDTAILV